MTESDDIFVSKLNLFKVKSQLTVASWSAEHHQLLSVGVRGKISKVDRFDFNIEMDGD